jgi:hypothetical protein
VYFVVQIAVPRRSSICTFKNARKKAARKGLMPPVFTKWPAFQTELDSIPVPANVLF